jgi:hypothetical protein
LPQLECYLLPVEGKETRKVCAWCFRLGTHTDDSTCTCATLCCRGSARRSSVLLSCGLAPTHAC